MIEGLLLLFAAIVALPVISLIVSLVQRGRQTEWIRRTEALERRVESLAASLAGGEIPSDASDKPVIPEPVVPRVPSPPAARPTSPVTRPPARCSSSALRIATPPPPTRLMPMHCRPIVPNKRKRRSSPKEPSINELCVLHLVFTASSASADARWRSPRSRLRCADWEISRPLPVICGKWRSQ